VRIDSPTCLDDCLHDSNTCRQVKSRRYNRCSVSLNLTSAPAWCKPSTVSAHRDRGTCEWFAREAVPSRRLMYSPPPPALRLHYTLYCICGVWNPRSPCNYFGVITISSIPRTNKWFGDRDERRMTGRRGWSWDRCIYLYYVCVCGDIDDDGRRGWGRRKSERCRGRVTERAKRCRTQTAETRNFCNKSIYPQ